MEVWKLPVFLLLSVVVVLNSRQGLGLCVCVCVCVHVCVCVYVVNPILPHHVVLSAIWLQPSTPPTKHLGCDLQHASCQHVSRRRNEMDTRSK